MSADHNLRPAVSACQPSRDDLLLLAGIQLRNAADAIDGGDVAAGLVLLRDALGFIERARAAG